METIVNILKKEIPGLQAVYLFGSRAEGMARTGSDTDLAFLAGLQPMDALLRFQLSQKLADVLKTEVDLVDLRTASTVLRFEIVSKGTRIYCLDQTECDLFEMTVYSMYQHLQEERKEIMEDILKRKSVYAFKEDT